MHQKSSKYMYCKVCSFSKKKLSIRQSEAFKKHTVIILRVLLFNIYLLFKFSNTFFVEKQENLLWFALNIVLHLIICIILFEKVKNFTVKS